MIVEMSSPDDVTHPSPETIAAPLVARLRDELSARDAPLFVGLDGRSGTGKSTVAAAVAAGLARGSEHANVAVTVIDGDDFYAGGSATSWDERTSAEKARCVIDWRRQRSVLAALRERGVAAWFPFDWDAEDWDSESVPLASEPVRCTATPVVILEGAYSCRPELHEVLDLLVLLEIPRDVRRQQLLAREGDEYRADWEARWSAAEDYYFADVMPAERFDLVLGSGQRAL